MLTQKQKYKRISAAFNKGLIALVVELCKKYLHQFPDDYFAWMWYGMAKTQLHRYDEAETAICRAMALWQKPGLQVALRQMGDLFKAKGDFEKAEYWYRRASRHKPGSTVDHIFAGDVAFQDGRLKLAELNYRRAIKCSTGPIEEAYFNLGGVLVAKRRYQEAIKCYRKALMIDPKYRIAAKRLKDA
ncbi:MAG: hypothetical protein QOD03_1596, partial [Verrucomicrobiota bacterium]